MIIFSAARKRGTFFFRLFFPARKRDFLFLLVLLLVFFGVFVLFGGCFCAFLGGCFVFSARKR